MKKFIVIILIYSIIALIPLAIMSIPAKVDQEKIEANIQREMDSMRKFSEEHWPDMPEEIRENSLKINEDIIRRSYETSNTFSSNFVSNLKAFFIGLAILIVVIIVRSAHLRELWGR